MCLIMRDSASSSGSVKQDKPQARRLRGLCLCDAAVALTAYFVSQYLCLNYVRKLSHLSPLWFANVCNSILWFTFVKACWRAVGAACGKSITFKTTIKGANALMSSALGDLWMPILVLGGGLASFGTSFLTAIDTQHPSLHWCIQVFT